LRRESGADLASFEVGFDVGFESAARVDDRPDAVGG
jgi:hypothetical protein